MMLQLYKAEYRVTCIFKNVHRIKSCSWIAVDQQGHFMHGNHAEISIFQKPNNDLLAGIYSLV